MITVLIFVISNICTFLFTMYECNPKKSWEEGYTAAKEMYTDWEDGFNRGFKSAKSLPYDSGFEDGWNAAFEVIRSIDVEDGESK